MATCARVTAGQEAESKAESKAALKAARKAERKAARKAERKAARKAEREAEREAKEAERKAGPETGLIGDAVGLTDVEARIKALEAELAATSEDCSDSNDEDQQSSPGVRKRQALARGEAGEQEAVERQRKRARKDGGDVFATALYCAVCRISVNSREMMAEHLSGWKHKAEKKARLPRAEGRYCDACSLEFTSPEQLAEHCEGRLHQEALRSGGKGKGKGGGKGSGDGKGKGVGRGGKGKGKSKGKVTGKGKGKGGIQQQSR